MLFDRKHLVDPRALTASANRYFPYFLIIAMGWICYEPSLDASLTLDDFPSIIQNRAIQQISDLRSLWAGSTTRFLAYLSFALNFHVHGLQVYGYHMVNLVIHLCAAFTLFLLVRALFLTPEMKGHPMSSHAREIALAVSMIFVVHPIQVQAVTYVVQRLTSLCALFYLLSLLFFLKYRIHLENTGGSRVSYYILCVLAAIAAMFTKEIAATLPICIVLLEIFFFSPRPGRLFRNVRLLWPALLTLPVIPVTYLVTRQESIKIIGLATETDSISRTAYLLTQFNVIRTYLRLLFLPVGQSVDYDYPISHRFFEPSTFLSFLLLLLVLALGLILFKRHRLVSFGVFFFFLTLSVESSIIPITDVLFEHRLYLPSMGIFLSSSILLFQWLDQRPRTVFCVFAIAVSLLSLATIERNLTWKEQVLLWNDAVQKSPGKFRAYLNRGVGYREIDKPELALRDFDLASRLDREHPYPFLNRGVIFLNRGDYESAVSEFTTGLRREPGNARAFLSRGLAYLGMGRREEAYRDFSTAANLQPDDPFYLNALGAVCIRLERYDVAYLALTRAIALNDRFATAYLNRGRTSLLLGKFEAAIKDFTRAAELAPHIPQTYDGRGLAYAGRGEYGQAVHDFTRAIMLKPQFVEAYSNRGMAYHRLGLSERALLDLNRAVELNPSLPKLYRNRAKVLQSLGRGEEAKSDLAESEAMEKRRE